VLRGLRKFSAGRHGRSSITGNYSRFVRKVQAAGVIRVMRKLCAGRQEKSYDTGNYSRFIGKVKVFWRRVRCCASCPGLARASGHSRGPRRIEPGPLQSGPFWI